MKVTCYICGDMCFDGCKDENKEMVEHYNNSDFHKNNLRNGFGKYHFFGSDHHARYCLAIGIDDIIDQLDNCGGYVP